MHEREHAAVFEQVTVLNLFDERAFDLFGGAEALDDLDAVGDASQLQVRHRRALARVDIFCLQDNGQFAVKIEHIAFADRACNNLSQRASPFLESLSQQGPLARLTPRISFNLMPVHTPTRPRGQPLHDKCCHSHHQFYSVRAQIMTVPDQNTPWWDPARHQDRRGPLLFRNDAKAAIRAYFAAEGFTEVDTGCLQVSPGNETHLHAFKTNLLGTDERAQPLYLHTSPEFSCKKLLAAGETKIFTFAPVFRNRERGALHHPEFTMLEWYRANEPVEAIMTDCVRIVQLMANAPKWNWRGTTCNAASEPARLTMRDVFQSHLGFDLGDSLANPTTPDRDLMATQATNAGVRVSDDDIWSDIFSRCLLTIEPEIWNSDAVRESKSDSFRPIFLEGYPAPEAPLAEPDDADPRFAKRFEMFACGIELANGYGELTDAALLRQRLEAEMDEKERIYGERYPLDEDFLAASAAMPPASGCALGFDRLVMLATRSDRIDQVLWTPMPDELAANTQTET